MLITSDVVLVVVGGGGGFVHPRPHNRCLPCVRPLTSNYSQIEEFCTANFCSNRYFHSGIGLLPKLPFL